jgi:hypothetical protein
MPTDRSVRLSQALSPFGVGAIYDVLGDSFVAADISRWKARGEVLRAPRLERNLGVAQLKSPPVRRSRFGTPKGAGVPYIRFPRWLFCSACRRMRQWNVRSEEEGDLRCLNCRRRRTLVPMRFITICRDGHMDDVPWRRWAHSNAEHPAQKQCQAKALEFRTRKLAGGGLGSLEVACVAPGCGARRSLAGISAPGALAQIGEKCRGMQPWQYTADAAPHDVVPEVVQRGASNVHFAHIETSIDIPPESRFSEFSDAMIAVTSHQMFAAVMSAPDGPLAPPLIKAIAEECGVYESDVRAAVATEVRRQTGEGDVLPPDDLQAAEWLAFITPQPEGDDRDRFVTKHVDLGADGYQAPPAVESLIAQLDKVVMAVRLREVRALKGFSRLEPGAPIVLPDLGRGLNWLPAIEVFGEGIFLSLSEELVTTWEGGPAQSRLERLGLRRDVSRMAFWLPEVSPRFVLLHTLAHLLIRQLAFESGYSSASLRERIYSRSSTTSGPEAGVLIYTAAGDAEGTLGGLVRQAEPRRLAPSLLALLQRALWCGNDPICRDSGGQGIDSLNLAACHACVLISETSCVYRNALLDRMLVVGEPKVSFFDAPLRLALEASAN